MRIRKTVLAAVAAVVGLAWAGSAQANTIEIMVTSAVPAGGGNTTYGFSLILTPGNGLSTAPAGLESGFILPDVAPTAFTLTSGVTLATDWSASTTDPTGTTTLGNVTNSGTSTTIFANTGHTTSVTAPDASGSNDFILKYTGSGLAVNSPLDSPRVLLTGTFTSPVGLGTLAAETTLSRDTSSAGTQVETFGVINGVPLPATASTGLSLFAGLGALVGLRKLTSRRSVA